MGNWKEWSYGVVQFNPIPGAIEHNAERIIELGLEAKARGAEIIIFPETALSGYCISDLHKNLQFVRKNLDLLRNRIAPAFTDCVLILGHLDLDESMTMPDGLPARRNAYSVICDRGLVATGWKTLLINDGVLDDSRHYAAGTTEDIKPVRVTLGDKTLDLGVLICQDMWDDSSEIKPAKLLAERGAEVLITLNSSPFYVGKLARRKAVAARRVRETGLPMVYVNTTGAQDNGKNIILFDGGSFILDTRGDLALGTPMFSEDVHCCRPSEDRATTEVVLPRNRWDELRQALVMGIRDYYHKAGAFKGALIGLSGGVDSAVDACLLVDALGPEKVLGVNMPSRFNSDITRDIAVRLAKRLGIEYLVYPIQDVVDLKVAAFRQAVGKEPAGLTVENIQARERGNILMTMSQERDLMVVGNGNKTEFQRGYATLYGDIIGALMPLGDVNKLGVYQLAREINRAMGNPIPEDVFIIKASAELSASQDVSVGKGDPFDYFVESPLGVELVENGLTPEELTERFASRTLDPDIWPLDGESRSVYEKMTRSEFLAAARATLRAIRRTYFKRVQSPPILVVSPRSFGFDFREALLVSYID